MKPTGLTTFILTLYLSCAPIDAPFAMCATDEGPSGVAPQATAQPAPESAALDRLFTSAVKPGDPGLTVLVSRKGQVLLRSGYGLANVELGVPARPEHVFRIASVTKQFTSAIIMMLAEEGRLSVSDPLTKYLPDYPVLGRTITIEHLLTHTSGIHNYTDIPAWRQTWRQDLSLAALIDTFKNEPLDFVPGEQWKYSNSGYVLLGAVIEKVTGTPYATVVQDRIFGPLGMASSRYDSTEDVIPNRAAGYARANGRIVNAAYLSMTHPHAAGALVSTVDDLAKWDAALSGTRLLQTESIARMFTPYLLASGKATTYGYGWNIGTISGRAVQEHGGGINGYRAYVLRIPAEGIFVAILSGLADQAPNPELLAHKAAAIALGLTGDK
jgi:D-alanyl-D-alanine carboxypeptidase